MRLLVVTGSGGDIGTASPSSWSPYGAHGDTPLDETAELQPVTPCGESNVLSERDLHAVAEADFRPHARDGFYSAVEVAEIRAAAQLATRIVLDRVQPFASGAHA
jgi:hypothetical protein